MLGLLLCNQAGSVRKGNDKNVMRMMNSMYRELENLESKVNRVERSEE